MPTVSSTKNNYVINSSFDEVSSDIGHFGRSLCPELVPILHFQALIETHQDPGNQIDPGVSKRRVFSLGWRVDLQSLHCGITTYVIRDVLWYTNSLNDSSSQKLISKQILFP